MKAKEAVAGVVQSPEYQEFCQFVQLAVGTKEVLSPDAEIVERITNLFNALNSRLGKAKKEFVNQLLPTYRPQDPAKNRTRCILLRTSVGVVNQGAAKNLILAYGSFDSEVKRQMPVFWHMLQEARLLSEQESYS